MGSRKPVRRTYSLLVHTCAYWYLVRPEGQHHHTIACSFYPHTIRTHLVPVAKIVEFRESIVISFVDKVCPSRYSAGWEQGTRRVRTSQSYISGKREGTLRVRSTVYQVRRKKSPLVDASICCSHGDAAGSYLAMAKALCSSSSMSPMHTWRVAGRVVADMVDLLGSLSELAHSASRQSLP